ncbi:hypothetical protein CROQUDRAFT_672425 [Cronartium quercuum f. sp. fusiforme G11]|uniref:Uncharacterized protein n=1 Tax=Cronartium quercuum f. sp. fusiforme G11 TaxID=708437 RepID=A0A9P6NEY3_9BASI|nr:hypothetical protein CROQUDRAFT_672425 [Cronartium quercuum f. sp. fusiforme G11]
MYRFLWSWLLISIALASLLGHVLSHPLNPSYKLKTKRSIVELSYRLRKRAFATLSHSSSDIPEVSTKPLLRLRTESPRVSVSEFGTRFAGQEVGSSKIAGAKPAEISSPFARISPKQTFVQRLYRKFITTVSRKFGRMSARIRIWIGKLRIPNNWKTPWFGHARVTKVQKPLPVLTDEDKRAIHRSNFDTSAVDLDPVPKNEDASNLNLKPDEEGAPDLNQKPENKKIVAK